MGRHKIIQKNLPISISLLPNQCIFIKNNPSFNLSKFVQLQLDMFIPRYLEHDEYRRIE